MVTAVVELAGTLIPARLTVVTLHTYWSHSPSPSTSDLVRVMLVLEVV